MQCYSGIAPVKEASGKTEWAKAYYDDLRKDEKKDHHTAVRSLAFKWIRIIFRCWKDGKPYDDEHVYQNSLRRRGSLLGKALAASTSVGWKTVAGFQKLSAN